MPKYRQKHSDIYVIDTSNTLSHVLTATTGETTTYYVFGIGLLYQEEDGETLFYHFNNIGSTEAVTDIDGKIVEKFAYGPYGELLSENKCGIMYLYNGEYGVATDENGLYYMRARYYNSEIKRFVNQDVLIGTISDSPTMNRYAYVNGNPISLADPFGLSPSINWNAAGHTALSFLGLLTIIPTPVTVVIGVLANVANALWYASEGNYFEALCCTVGALGGAYSFLKITGLATKSCVLTSVIKNSTAVGSIAMGGIDIAMVGYDNYQKYVVRGEDFSWTDAALDTARIVLDSTAIAAGLQLYSEPVPTCFVAGTLVATADGHVAIEEIQVGDMVLAGDPETGEVAYKEVTRTFVNESDELIHVHTNGEEIITTPTHPFYVNQFGWTHAADLRAGDVLVLSNGEYVVVEAIQHEILESPVKVYNFEVEGFHTYFVGESSVLVHNECTRKQGQYHVYDKYTLDETQYYKSDSVQFRLANKSLLKKLQSDPSFRKNMYRRHPELADWVASGNRSSSPTGFLWHHSQTPGVLELVDAADHSHNFKFYHYNGVGGRAIWGGGRNGRRGRLDEFGNLLAKYLKNALDN